MFYDVDNWNSKAVCSNSLVSQTSHKPDTQKFSRKKVELFLMSSFLKFHCLNLSENKASFSESAKISAHQCLLCKGVRDVARAQMEDYYGYLFLQTLISTWLIAVP